MQNRELEIKERWLLSQKWRDRWRQTVELSNGSVWRPVRCHQTRRM